MHNDEVVVQYEIMILGAMGIQADYIGIAHVIQTSEQLDSLRVRKVLFSWYDLEIKFTVPAGGVVPGPESYTQSRRSYDADNRSSIACPQTSRVFQ